MEIANLKFQLDEADYKAIAKELADQLKPVIKSNGSSINDKILTVESLAEYLSVEPSWVYKKISLKEIPYFKAGKYVRFKKSSIDKWIEQESVNPIPFYKK